MATDKQFGKRDQWHHAADRSEGACARESGNEALAPTVETRSDKQARVQQ